MALTLPAIGPAGPPLPDPSGVGRRVVCLLGKYPFGRQSGSVTYLRMLARGAAGAGFAPHVFCVGPRTETVQADFGTVHVTRVPGRPEWPYLDAHAPLLAPWLVPSVVRFAAGRPGPVLLHGLSLWGWTGLLAARSLRRRGRDAVAVVSAYDTKGAQFDEGRAGASLLPGAAGRWRWRLKGLWERQLLPFFEGPTYRRSRLVLVNYASVERLLTAAFGPGLPVHRIPYAPETAFIEEPLDLADPGPGPDLGPLGGRPGPLVVATSRHDLHKGVDVLVDALGRLAAQGLTVRACLLGRGPLIEATRERVRRHRLERVVLVAGQVPDPFPYVRHADVFVLPSRGEGGSGSLSLLEALQAGRPIVASACDGIPEDVEDGVSACLVPPGDPARLADSLRRLLGDASLRARLGRGAREAFERRFSAGALVESLGRVYGSLVGAGGERGVVPPSRPGRPPAGRP